MANRQSVEIVGTVVFWNIASLSNRPKLLDGLKDIGIADCDPPKRTVGSAAREALESATKHRDTIVRPLEHGIGFVAIQEIQGTFSNKYVDVGYIHVDSDGIIAKHFDDVKDWSEEQTIRDAVDTRFAESLNECDSNHVAKSLANIVRALGGVTLRPNGGVYWLPEYSQDTFKKVVALFESSAIRGTTSIHQLQTAKDDAAVRAIHEVLCSEVNDRVNEIQSEIVDRGDKLSKTVLKNRSAELETLRSKVASYETLLEANLADLRNAIQNANVAVGTAAIVELAAGAASIL